MFISLFVAVYTSQGVLPSDSTYIYIYIYIYIFVALRPSTNVKCPDVKGGIAGIGKCWHM